MTYGGRRVEVERYSPLPSPGRCSSVRARTLGNSLLQDVACKVSSHRRRTGLSEGRQDPALFPNRPRCLGGRPNRPGPKFDLSFCVTSMGHPNLQLVKMDGTGCVVQERETLEGRIGALTGHRLAGAGVSEAARNFAGFVGLLVEIDCHDRQRNNRPQPQSRIRRA